MYLINEQIVTNIQQVLQGYFTKQLVAAYMLTL